MIRSVSLRYLGAAACAASLVVFGHQLAARAAGVPAEEPLVYAGTLEEDGAFVDGDVPIGFALFDDGDAAAPDRRLCDVPSANRSVRRGRFRIDTSACRDALSDSAEVFVELTVRGAPLPRTKVGAVPYALEADRAQTAVVAEAVAGGAIDAAAIAPGAVGAAAIATNAIDVSKLADASVGIRQLGDNQITSEKILDRTIQGNDVLARSLGGDLLQDGSIGAAKLAPGDAVASLVRRCSTNCTQTDDGAKKTTCQCNANEVAIRGGGFGAFGVVLRESLRVQEDERAWRTSCTTASTGLDAFCTFAHVQCARTGP